MENPIQDVIFDVVPSYYQDGQYRPYIDRIVTRLTEREYGIAASLRESAEAMDVDTPVIDEAMDKAGIMQRPRLTSVGVTDDFRADVMSRMAEIEQALTNIRSLLS